LSFPVTLTGCWVGHYFQHNQARPIAADLVHEGRRLSGRMRDGHTKSESSVFEAASEAGLPPGEDEQIVARLRSLVPGAAGGPVRYLMHLPTDSVLEGRVEAGTVYFLKTYQGSHRIGFKVGDRLVGREIANHAVHYQGRLSPDGLEIEGLWWMAEPGGRRTEGRFRLRRQAPAETATAERAAFLTPPAAGAGARRER
jgi:hypothetical protein